MKLYVLFLVIALFFGVLNANNLEQDDSIYLRIFEELIKGPPIDEHMEISRAIETEWIEQKLDHFNASETRTWKMRYFINDEHYVAGGPIFIFVGGEWEVRAQSIIRGHFVDIAKKHNAILFCTEHRFYGQSQPLADLSNESLQYLNVNQSLADLAYFIEYQKKNNSLLVNSKVILYGCSYAGSMVTWFKRTYPDLISGGWVSSGPLIAKVDFAEYKIMVGKAIKQLGGEDCYNRIDNGIAGFEKMFAEKRGAEVKAMLRLCNSFDENNDMDFWNLFGTISNTLSSVVQYQKNNDVQILCNSLMQAGDNDVNALANYILFMWKVPITSCVNLSYKSSVANLLKTSYSNARSWYYQTCNEFGWYQTATTKATPFGKNVPVTLWINKCGDIFSKNYVNSTIHENAANTNANFGGLNPGVSNIYTAQGALDPWSTAGLPLEKGATYIAESSHCADSPPISANDSEEMLASKKRVEALIDEWLKN